MRALTLLALALLSSCAYAPEERVCTCTTDTECLLTCPWIEGDGGPY